jgi:hypothetical protein
MQGVEAVSAVGFAVVRADCSELPLWLHCLIDRGQVGLSRFGTTRLDLSEPTLERRLRLIRKTWEQEVPR